MFAANYSYSYVSPHDRLHDVSKTSSNCQRVNAVSALLWYSQLSGTLQTTAQCCCPFVKLENCKSPQTSPFIFLQDNFFQAQYLDFGFWIHISHLKSLQYDRVHRCSGSHSSLRGIHRDGRGSFFLQGARNFGTWMSYLTNFGEHKVRIPVSKKRGLSWRYFHFLLSLNDYPPSQNPLSIGLWRMQRMVSLAYPVYRLDLALLSAVILFHHWFPQLEKNW